MASLIWHILFGELWSFPSLYALLLTRLIDLYLLAPILFLSQPCSFVCKKLPTGFETGSKPVWFNLAIEGLQDRYLLAQLVLDVKLLIPLLLKVCQ